MGSTCVGVGGLPVGGSLPAELRAMDRWCFEQLGGEEREGNS